MDFTAYEVTAGTIALILPGQLHSIEQFETESMEYENIIFTPNMLISKDGHLQHGLLQPLTGNIAILILYTPDFPHYKRNCRLCGCQ